MTPLTPPGYGPDIYAVQGLGGINEMMVHIRKRMLILRRRQFTLVGSSLHPDL